MYKVYELHVRTFQKQYFERCRVFYLSCLFYFLSCPLFLFLQFLSVAGIGDAQRGQQAPSSAAPSSSCGRGCVEAAEVASSAGPPPPGEAFFSLVALVLLTLVLLLVFGLIVLELLVLVSLLVLVFGANAGVGVGGVIAGVGVGAACVGGLAVRADVSGSVDSSVDDVRTCKAHPLAEAVAAFFPNPFRVPIN